MRRGAVVLVALAAAAPWPSWGDTALLSFDEAIEQILARSTEIASREASLGFQRAANLPIRWSFAPSVSLDAKQAATRVLGTTLDTHQVEGVAQLNLFRWGADYKNWQAATLDESTQQLLVEDARLKAQDLAVGTVISYLERRKEVSIAEGIVKMRQDSLVIAEQRYKGGYLPRQDMEKVSVDLANSEARLADARIASATAEASLAGLLGHARVALEWPWQERFDHLSVQAIEALSRPLSDEQATGLLSERPDWRAAQAKADAEDARVSRAWRLMGPTLDGQLSYGYYSDPYATTQWQGILSVSWPLFDHLTLYSNARAQTYTRSSAEIALEQVRRDARSDYDSARDSYVLSLRSARVRDKTLEVSRRLFQDGLQRFKGGRISADELVLEQMRLYDSELLAVQGWASVHEARSHFCKAKGLSLKNCAD